MNREKLTNRKLPPNLLLTSILSGGLTAGLSLIYILLSITFLLVRTRCEFGSISESTGADYFWQTIVKVYVLSESCTDTAIIIQRLTSDTTLLVLVSVTLAMSFLCLAAAITLIIIIRDESPSRYVTWAVYAYSTCCVVSLMVDVVTGSLFGIDHTYLTSLLKELSPNSPANYRIDVIRQGAFWLMTIALKGYVAHLINCVLLVLMAVYLYEYIKAIKSNEHAIHKLGVLNAFDQQSKPDDNWTQVEMYNNSAFNRGPNINSAFVEDLTPPRSPMHQQPTRNDYNPSRSFDRSDSWHHSRHNTPQNTRPFSYLEDIKRPMPPKLQPPPPMEPQWRREPSPAADTPWRREPSPAIEMPWRRDPWPQEPPVPAPDYSPNMPRRLKSALKPTY